MPDRHKTKPKAVRMPDGLLAWYEEHAKATGQAVNAALVGALEDFRARNSGATANQRGATAAVPVQRPRGAAPVASELARERARDRREDACPHPKARIHKGLCGACGTNVGTGK